MSERGSNSDEERAVVVDERAENNNNNNNKNEAAEDAALDQHQHDHSGLLTVGEKCVHLICEFIRTFRANEASIMGTLFTTSAVTLSRLSRTCRTLYIYVRNLPSVLEQIQPQLTMHPLTRGTIGLDLGYWADVVGLIWEVYKPQKVLSLTSRPQATSAVAARKNDASKDYARLGGLFLHLHKLTGIGTLSDAECTELLHILEHCGGLSFSVYGNEEDLVTSLGLDLRRCKNLRYLHVSVEIKKRSGYESYEALVRQLAEMEVKPRYASVTVIEMCSHTLMDLSAFRGFQQIRTFWRIELRSLEGAQRAQFVDLRNLRLTDVSALANVHTVELFKCSNITDITALGNAHTVVLDDCESVADVSALGGVHTLRLSLCDSVTDVSALSTVEELEIRDCANATNLDTLPNLLRIKAAAARSDGGLSGTRSVDLSHRKDVTDVSALGHVHTLNLAGCNELTDVSALGRVHCLNLAWCLSLADVSALGHVHTLNLKRCFEITDVSMLGNVYSLDLSDCRNITDVSALGHVHTLNLRDCINVSDASMLGGVHTLSLAWCNWLTDVRPLATVHRLNLSHCNGITDVSSLEDVTHLCLNGCENVTNASALINKVPFLEF